jgi:hypothetical protein
MPQYAFKRGYLVGWQWMRGAEEAPEVPPYSSETVAFADDPYLAGIARGIRDAGSAPMSSTEYSATRKSVPPSADNWFRRWFGIRR